MATVSRRALPGFTPSLTFSLAYLTLLVFIPLAACFLRASSLTPGQFWAAVWTERARAAYALTFGTSLAAAAFDTVFGLLIAWVIVRYDFPLKRLFDAIIDLPFALPTAVAGLVYSSLYVPSGWFGKPLSYFGIDISYSRFAIVWVLTFIGLPFIVRAVQPVLEDFDMELEEASASLGAGRLETFRRVILPSLAPALITGFALAFARGLGEYGSVIFVSSNIPLKTEIAPRLIVDLLLQGSDQGSDYAAPTAIAVVLLLFSFGMLIVINGLEAWSKRHAS